MYCSVVLHGIAMFVHAVWRVVPCREPSEPFSAGHGRLQGQQAKRRSATVASAMDGAGYNSDEEVYAVARAIDAEDEVHLLRPLATDLLYSYKDANMELPWAQVQQE